MPTNKSKWIFVAGFALVAGFVIARVYAQAKKDPPDHDDQEQAVGSETSSRLVQRNGETFIRLTPAEQVRAGIETVELRAARERKKIDAPAMALDATGLVNLEAAYSAEQTRLRTAENDLSMTQREYERLKSLYANLQDVSAKSFQAGEAAYHNNQLAVAAARRNLQLRIAAVRQSWGDGVAEWFEKNSKPLDRVLNRKDTLVEVTLSSGGPQIAPGEITLELPNHDRLRASLVSRFPRVDPRVQGASFLYVAPTESSLAPGLNLMAQIPAGRMATGVEVPLSAVVWLNGQPWVYIESSANEFTRRNVDANFPVEGGFFVLKGLAAGEHAVTAGAQMILSEEFRSQSGGGDEGDED